MLDKKEVRMTSATFKFILPRGDAKSLRTAVINRQSAITGIGARALMKDRGQLAIGGALMIWD
jgi:hypothetical protein